MSNFDKHVLAFSPNPFTLQANSAIQSLQCIRKIINFRYTFGWKWWVFSFRDYLGLSDACSYDVIGRADRFGFQNFCSPVCMTVSGCDRELNAHFYSAASLKYHVPDTWHDTTPSHIILTLGRPVLTLPHKSECQARSSHTKNWQFLPLVVITWE